jgi:4-carboxymuconolactone decarboxylase
LSLVTDKQQKGATRVKTRFEMGLDTVTKMVGEEGVAASLGIINQFSPDFYNVLIEFGFGEVYSRPGLGLKTRELLTLSSLITQGAEGQLPFHLRAALNLGITPEEIVEIVLHCTPYAGFPRGCGALAVVMKVFKELNIPYGSDQSK